MGQKLLYTVFLLTFSSYSWACDCVPNDSIANAYKEASLIFKGKVIKIDTVLISDTTNVISSSTNSRPHIKITLRKLLSVKFSIAQIIKGDSQNKIEIVMTDAVETRCGSEFIPNVSYIVYCYSRKIALVGNTKKNKLKEKPLNIIANTTSSCTRTTTAITEEISELRNNKLII